MTVISLVAVRLLITWSKCGTYHKDFCGKSVDGMMNATPKDSDILRAKEWNEKISLFTRIDIFHSILSNFYVTVQKRIPLFPFYC